jgi:hypothetical protein
MNYRKFNQAFKSSLNAYGSLPWKDEMILVGFLVDEYDLAMDCTNLKGREVRP